MGPKEDTGKTEDNPEEAPKDEGDENPPQEKGAQDAGDGGEGEGDGGTHGKCTKKKLLIMYAILLALLFIGGTIETFMGIVVEKRLILTSYFADPEYQVAPLIVTACGVVIFVTCFIGIFAATRDSFILLVAYFRCLLVVGLLELLCFLLAIILMEVKSGIFYSKMEKYIREYQKFYQAVDNLQNLINCCGYNNMTDFPQGVPWSCCKKDTSIFCSDFYEHNCKNSFEKFLHDSGLTIALLTLFMLVIKILCCVVAWFFGKKLKHGIDYGEDEDPEKVRMRDERNKEKRQKRREKRKKDREKKKMQAAAFKQKEEEKAQRRLDKKLKRAQEKQDKKQAKEDKKSAVKDEKK